MESANDGEPERFSCVTYQEEGEFDLAEGVRRCCKKNSPSVLPCIGKRTEQNILYFCLKNE